jgi:murein DD-endopeptidase MepM/ murein hydrolase activator NlpD
MNLAPRVFSGFLVLTLFATAFPLSAEAARSNRSLGGEGVESVFRRSYDEADGGRYSGSLRRKIRALDDDIVEEIPIPVLSVSYSKLWPDFGAPRGGGTRKHQGQDIFAPYRTPIVSPTEAVVTRIGNGESAGIYVYTANPGGEVFAYMHLDEVAPNLKRGDVLKAGDLIGFMGDTGNAKGTPYHLHFEIRDGRRAVDPYPRLTGSFTPEEQLKILAAIVDALKKLA